MKNKWSMICGVIALGLSLVSCGRTPGTVNAELPELKGGDEGATRTGVPLTNADMINELSGLGFKIIDWSVDTRDWAGTPAPKIMDNVKKEMTPGGIILQHCAGGRNENLSNTVAALPQIISFLESNGYSFATIPELLKVPSSM
jgi:peptidoglycan/xylan/chitin deacetylase (PgdA/CDA1 family)